MSSEIYNGVWPMEGVRGCRAVGLDLVIKGVLEDAYDY